MLISDFLKQNLWLDSTKSNAFSGTIEAGKVLHIEGLEKSTVADDNVDETDMALHPGLSPETRVDPDISAAIIGFVFGTLAAPTITEGP